jgi:hypothetical protein
MVIVNPTSGETPPKHAARTLLPDLRGKTVGFLSNSKTNADQILEGVAEGLVARYGIVPRLYVKRVPSIGAERELLDEIARDCAAAVVAMLDCGSCASWACADMVELSQRGLAVCGMASDQFDAFSRQVLGIKGADDLGLSVVEHPVGGIAPEAAKARVGPAALEQVILALTGKPSGAKTEVQR